MFVQSKLTHNVIRVYISNCGPIPSIENGSYVTTNGTTYPSAGYMLCDEGFVLTYSSPDDAILRCEENGVWNFRPVTCMPVGKYVNHLSDSSWPF